MRKPLPIHIALALLASALIASVGRADVCVDPADSDCEATIQDGVDAASPGETVRVAEGVYLESVTIPRGKDGLTLEGDDPSETVVDGESGVALRVDSDDVTVRALTILRSRTGIDLDNSLSARIEQVTLRFIDGAAIAGDDSDFAVIEGVTVESANSAIGMVADDLEVRDSSFTGVGSGVAGSGDDWSLEDNVFERVARDAIYIEGDGAVLRGNTFASIGERAIVVPGPEALVEANSITDAETGVFVSGDDFRVLRNEVTHTRAIGIHVDCDGCSAAEVSENTLVGTGEPYAIKIVSRSRGLQAIDNRVEDAVGAGIFFNANDALLSGATVKGCGSSGSVPAAGIELADEDSVVELSLVSSCTGDGFRLSDTSNVVRDSEAKKNGEDGFDLQAGPNDLVGNLAKKNIGIGFEVSSGSGSLLEGNEASDNRDSFCDEGSATSAVDNDFPTTAVPCAIGD